MTSGGGTPSLGSFRDLGRNNYIDGQSQGLSALDYGRGLGCSDPSAQRADVDFYLCRRLRRIASHIWAARHHHGDGACAAKQRARGCER